MSKQGVNGHDIIHLALILYLQNKLYNFPHFQLGWSIILCQTLFTISKSKQKITLSRTVEILLSLSLFSYYFGKNLIWLTSLFTLKLFTINEILTRLKYSLLSKQKQLLRASYDFFRITLVWYLFWGTAIVFYKVAVFYFDQSYHELPSNYYLFYLMLDIAITVGYGDICPQSRFQMNFHLLLIPIVMGSCIIYNNAVNPLCSIFYSYWNGSLEKNSEIGICTEDLQDFQHQIVKRKIAKENMRHSYFNDWISIAAINYEKGAELIHTIIDPTFPKEIKLAVTSKVRHEYFPKDWVILDANDINQELFMVVEGQIDINGVTKSTGFVFNQKGFFCRASSGDKVVTKTFVTNPSKTFNNPVQISKNLSNY